MKAKHLLAASLLMLATGSLSAQKSAKDVANTLKERITLSGYAQGGFTSAWIPSSSYGETKNLTTFDVKRIVLMAHANITNKWSVFYMGSLGKGYNNLEFYTAYRPCSEFGVRLGQFKTVFSIENQLSPASIETITLGSMATNFLAAGNGTDPLMGAQSGRDIGLEIYGDLFDRILGYRIGVINGQGMNTIDFNSSKTYEASLTIRPVTFLSFTGSYMNGNTIALNNGINGIEEGDTYNRIRWSVGGMLKTKYIDLRSEYLYGKDENSVTDGFYITGCARLFKNIDLIASYDSMDLYGITDLTGITTGLQYWFYPKCRLQIQYNYTKEKRSYVEQSVHSLLTQVQIGF